MSLFIIGVELNVTFLGSETMAKLTLLLTP